ncbi:hypothetical protein ACFPGO_03295 [Arcanobacterium canis]|uniref:SPW repeat-containing protein n=1 Tax=Arcanobacterium canis TaxID=999183 RepID=A0ABY8FWX2_9ACTO|nr:hypothetical protein [Arcanobacterium canis]WFM83017.1 hypothetical protein P7079_06360 [Arcanobacterium canis]
MKPNSDWKSRVLTLALLAGGAFVTALGVEAISRHVDLSLWFLVVVCVIYVAAYRGVRSLATTVTGARGFILDAVMSIPLGLLFATKELVLPVTEWGWSMFFNGVFIGFFVIFFTNYFYRRHPRNTTADDA